MDKQVALVVQGFIKLSATQQSEFVREINNYTQGNTETRDRIVKETRNNVLKVDVGPLSGGCPCCGRG